MIDPARAAVLLAGALVLIGPLTSPLDRRLFRTDPGMPRKLAAYAVHGSLAWAMTAAAVWVFGARLLDSPAAASAWLPAAAVVGPCLGLLLAGYFVLGLQPLLQSLRGPHRRQAWAAAIRRHAGAFPGLLPNNHAERAGFVLLSLTAGVCEEALIRGFLIRFLHEGGLGLPVAGAFVVSSLIFGLGHFYQGWKGVLTTTVAGFAFGLLFLLSGSLLPGVLVHALVDLQVAYVLRPTSGEARAATVVPV